MLTYTKPLEIIDAHLAEHRAFLEEGCQKNYFIVSGPQNPRTGGVVISQLKNRTELEKIIHQDPFYLHQVADFNIIEFNPVKYHPDFAMFV